MNTRVPRKLTSPRRPPAALSNFLERRRNQPRSKCVPDLCQKIADLDVWQVWRDERTVSCVESVSVPVSIPSLATTSFQTLSAVFVSAECLTGVQIESKFGFHSKIASVYWLHLSLECHRAKWGSRQRLRRPRAESLCRAQLSGGSVADNILF